MKNHYEVLVIGGGPAGLAAATGAARLGLDVALVDEQKAPGGQIYRNVFAAEDRAARYLGKDYMRGKQLVVEFLQSGATYLNNASVWYLDERLETGLLIDGASHFVTADRLILATGAQERPMPLPGWQLPGVMTAGAGQILLKSAGIVPQGRLVLAGNGPLLLLLAWQYLQADVKIEALVDTTPVSRLRRALPDLPRALAAFEYLVKGVSLMRAISKARIPVYRHVDDLRAEGGESLEAVSFDSGRKRGGDGSRIQIDADTLMTHHGVIPNLRLALAAGCKVEWDRQQQCWKASTDIWGQSSVDPVMVAGDCAGIVGARAAELQGRLCALQAGHRLQKIDAGRRDRAAQPVTRSLARHLSIRPFLDKLYAPVPAYLLPGDDTLVCRCEEVRAGQIRAAARTGCVGPNQVKAFTRCGMGPCQGCLCASTVSALIADENGAPMEEVGYFRVRPPFKPITLGELSNS
ncbi:MAG: FAD-dependent oxidoreductase [Gammaproteobacteria bacterium]|nr:FAD-dependent oxidoreductase [Gammaproteobacteria bacterium]